MEWWCSNILSAQQYSADIGSSVQFKLTHTFNEHKGITTFTSSSIHPSLISIEINFQLCVWEPVAILHSRYLERVSSFQWWTGKQTNCKYSMYLVSRNILLMQMEDICWNSKLYLLLKQSSNDITIMAHMKKNHPLKSQTLWLKVPHKL